MGAVERGAGGAAPAPAVCRLSTTSSHPVPGHPSFNVGSKRLAVDLPKGARFYAMPDGSHRGGWAFIQTNGWIRTKLGWFAIGGAPHVSGRRLDGSGRRLRADVGPMSVAGGEAFYPSLLYFPSFGCWKITATVGNAHERRRYRGSFDGLSEPHGGAHRPSRSRAGISRPVVGDRPVSRRRSYP
jgi:hypothetical protein